MKITKFVHSCLLVEMPERTALFDPGSFSEAALDVEKLQYLDEIFITHIHGDHVSPPLLRKLIQKFPNVRITATTETAGMLAEEGITAGTDAPDGARFFDSPHEHVEPMFPTPQQIGVHYLDALSHPGDSHSFQETMPILALPVQAPWGATVRAVNLALELKPKHILPIHDWHWNDQARASLYDGMEKAFRERGITFHKLQTGEPVNIDL